MLAELDASERFLVGLVQRRIHDVLVHIGRDGLFHHDLQLQLVQRDSLSAVHPSKVEMQLTESVLSRVVPCVRGCPPSRLSYEGQ